MSIDLILERKGWEKFSAENGTTKVLDLNGNVIDKAYNPRKFYSDVMNYYVGSGSYYADIISAAMDYGEEPDVKKALCRYVMECEYNPEICDYINSRNWLTR